MNLREKEFRPWRESTYMVSADGYVYIAEANHRGIDGRFLLPFWQNGAMIVNVRIDGRAKQYAVSTLTLDEWGKRIKGSEELTKQMREEITAYHAHYLPAAVQSNGSAISKSLNDKNEALKDVMPCPWASGKLDTLPPGMKTWDCPEMDPMGCGSARVALKMETKDAQRRAA